MNSFMLSAEIQHVFFMVQLWNAMTDNSGLESFINLEKQHWIIVFPGLLLYFDHFLTT